VEKDTSTIVPKEEAIEEIKETEVLKYE